ncbi:MAG: hydrogenase maturation protease [SAR324 cluster bacterium]|nr:hydrogenase maturation protease [SAR324 cluster bacterium]
MLADTNKVLLIGYGNPGRLDDGLGPALVAKLESNPVAGLDVDSDYQLTVETAYDVAQYDTVIFADASINGREPFFLKKIYPQEPMSFSTHSVAPEAVLHLAQSLFQAKTEAYLLGIRGYHFNEFQEELSEQAENNLKAAFEYVVEALRTQRFNVTS